MCARECTHLLPGTSASFWLADGAATEGLVLSSPLLSPSPPSSECELGSQACVEGRSRAVCVCVVCGACVISITHFGHARALSTTFMFRG
jgi:hypothetical protein